MTQQDDYDNWSAAQFADELLRMQRAAEIIEAAGTRPLTADEQETIALEAGLSRKASK